MDISCSFYAIAMKVDFVGKTNARNLNDLEWFDIFILG